ncbi:peptidyl-prolyl cis-trans isomerase SurA [Flavobacterium arsenatis]|uniref:Peptidyl-prolyl cis-trans isomerase SurA n=1 Tax=Flavobacterium arsenatis TaxID=1484332 RepID=A0ABU1TJL3_9FLAO|nr:peptidylprolyl isomerase [Flavobacterium arsenatis]MDR6966184.1 peptidyl-prolyl cis-trans isomerase SurA [Flavobacterium arsenatis]
MKIKQLLFGLLLSANFVANAQDSKKEVLFSIDDKPYYTDEFSRVYKKNIDLVKDESQKDLNQYLELFVGYKLKINKANKLGLQNNPKYQNELKSYRSQLSKNYLTDTKVTKELIEEAYNRSQKEIKASHILIMVDENAAPADTLKAYNQALDIRKKAVAGEDFGKLAQQYSQDPSAKENQGDLGYFSALRMVYTFESGAYKTKKGEISKPIRTRFGYHLIKVNDVRDNRGKVTVAHIMIMKPAEGLNSEKGKAKIQDIYKKLQQGEKFEELAKQFSEDKSSSEKGGVLNSFSSGELSSNEFEDVAFSLSRQNPISEPFESAYGWHIVKFVEKHPVKSFEEMESELEGKIRKDDRSRLIVNSMNEKLRKKYAVKRDNKLYAALVKTVTNDIYTGAWKVPADTKNFDKNLFSVNEKAITGTTFLNYLNNQQKGVSEIKPVSKLVDFLYEKFLDEQLNVYYNDNLEKEFPEFADVMEEYRDGLLLFDLMEKEIWEKSKTDTIGLQHFYEKNSNNYKWKNRYDVLIVSSTKSDFIKKAHKMLKKDKSAEFIKQNLNTGKEVEVLEKEGVFEEGNEALPKNVTFKTGVTDVVKQGDYYFVTRVNKVLPAGNKTLEECKGKVVNDYQQYLEENWVSDLKKEFTIEVNKDTFEKVKKQIKS